MYVHCVHCQKVLKVPEAAIAAPRPRIGCGTCRGNFLLSEARPAAAPAPSVAAPTAPAPAAAPPPAPAPPASPRPTRPPAPGNWRRCAQHPQTRSEHVCPACKRGHCRDCVQLVRSAPICPQCEGLCIPAAQVEEKERLALARNKPMVDEIATVFGYPFTDVLAYVIMAVIVGVVNVLREFSAGIAGALFSQGLLMAYAFAALHRVSNGEMKGFMPSISDVSDLAVPMRQGMFAFLGATWPLIALAIAAPFALAGVEGVVADGGRPRVVHAQAAEMDAEPDDEPAEEASDPDAELPEGAAAEPDAPEVPARTATLLAVLVVAILWKVVYSPVALIVAAMTQSAGLVSSLFQTLNPLIGIGAIVRMGATYWQVLGIYCLIAVPQWLLGFVLNQVPFGGFFRGFVDGYAFICIGCALGLAVFKRAPELGLD